MTNETKSTPDAGGCDAVHEETGDECIRDAGHAGMHQSQLCDGTCDHCECIEWDDAPPRADATDTDDEISPCELCGKPSSGADAEGVPMCEQCISDAVRATFDAIADLVGFDPDKHDDVLEAVRERIARADATACARCASAWPADEVVRKLVDAADILLDRHNYDGHGWELLDIARKEARVMLAQPRADATAGSQFARRSIPASGGYVCDERGVIPPDVVRTMAETDYNLKQAMNALASLIRSHEAMRDELAGLRQQHVSNTNADATAGEVTEAMKRQIKTLEELVGVMSHMSVQALGYWHNDKDAKVGKILSALSGASTGYDVDLDRLRRDANQNRDAITAALAAPVAPEVEPGAVAWKHESDEPTEKGWYAIRRADGSLCLRAWGNGRWWIPLADGWLSDLPPGFGWFGPLAPIDWDTPRTENTIGEQAVMLAWTKAEISDEQRDALMAAIAEIRAQQGSKPHADAAAWDTRDDVIAAANTLYDRVESLFYAAPETHSYHYDRITKAMQAYDAARRAAQPDGGTHGA